MAEDLSDNEIIQFVFDALYSDGSYAYVPIIYVKDELGSKVHPWDIERIFNKFVIEGWAKRIKAGGEDSLKIDDKGMELMRKFHSYDAYLKRRTEVRELAKKKRAKEEREQRREHWPKRNWLIVVAITYVGGVLTPIIRDTIRQKIPIESKELKLSIPAGKDSAEKPKPSVRK